MFILLVWCVCVSLLWAPSARFEDASPVQNAKYLGCYIDNGGNNRLMRGHQENFPGALTQEICNKLCFEGGFAFAGTQYSVECFCSKTKPPNDKKSPDQQCDLKCAGDQAKVCGGNNRLSVYSTGAKEVALSGLNGEYLGCYIDNGGNDRLMRGHQENFPGELTQEICNKLCFEGGFAFAGTQYSVECFCSKTKPPNDKKSPDQQCDFKCAGDQAKICGGNNRLSVYKTGAKEVAVSGHATSANYLGCYIDGESGKRIMNGLQQNFPDSLTPDVCSALCTQKGFSYAGTQYRIECFCSKTKPADGKRSVDSGCDMKCSGDESKICGGNNRLSVYRTGIKDDSLDVADYKYIGCFSDFTNGTRLLSGLRQNYPDILTTELCSKFCKRKGYKYAGMEYGRECFCGNKLPSYENYAEEESCSFRCEGNNIQLCGGNWRLSVFHTGIAGPYVEYDAGKYIGCHKDQETPRNLGGFVKNFGSGLTLLKCTGLCYSMGYLYAGTQNSKECYCGDEHPSPNLKVNEEECSKPCSGEPNKKCGGDYRNSIRETGITDYPAEDKYLGCFNDNNNQIFKALKMTYTKTNSPRRCFNICLHRGFKYSGVEYGVECFCGNDAPAPNLAMSGDECSTQCSGDPLETCGAGWRMAVYSIDLESTVQVVTGKPTVPTTPATTTSPTCQKTDTIVNGKPACKGEVIFSEEFKTPLGNKWKNVVLIPESPDNEFVVLHADSKNCFISKNNLVIKPTIFNEDQVLNGALQLQGCTGNLGTRECGYQAFSFNILPPVASARVNTRESFTFRYGIVEIRAKLPTGDWLVPEIWLEPKNHESGAEYYQSGRIRLAMCRGNQQLQCGGDDLSRTAVESGIMMGPEDDVRSRSVHSTLPDNWHDHFHTYTLIWRPDSISFIIDNEVQQELIPRGRSLCEVTGFSSQQCATWWAGSRIAPFNSEFYISLGLSAGNSRDFPDNCLNKGRRKPWRNWEVKAMLKFWQDKDNWFSTWSDDKSALYVEYVRVKAL